MRSPRPTWWRSVLAHTVDEAVAGLTTRTADAGAADVEAGEEIEPVAMDIVASGTIDDVIRGPSSSVAGLMGCPSCRPHVTG